MSDRDDLEALVRAAFRGEAAARALTLLGSYGIEAWERERERVQCAIVALAQGSEAKLAELVALAKRDYRDVLLWAEYPAEAKLDTPEKRRRVREGLERLGVPIPPGHFDDS